MEWLTLVCLPHLFSLLASFDVNALYNTAKCTELLSVFSSPSRHISIALGFFVQFSFRRCVGTFGCFIALLIDRDRIDFKFWFGVRHLRIKLHSNFRKNVCDFHLLLLPIPSCPSATSRYTDGKSRTTKYTTIASAAWNQCYTMLLPCVLNTRSLKHTMCVPRWQSEKLSSEREMNNKTNETSPNKRDKEHTFCKLLT